MSESTTARPARLAGRGANDDASGVTLTVAELAAAIRLGDSPEETAQVKRLLSFATLAVSKHAPDAPDIIQNEAAILVAGYIYDSPMAAKGASYSAVLRNCGAGSLMLPWRTHRAGNVAEAGRG